MGTMTIPPLPEHEKRRRATVSLIDKTERWYQRGWLTPDEEDAVDVNARAALKVLDDETEWRANMDAAEQMLSDAAARRRGER